MTWYDTIYRKRKSLAHWQITCGPSEREVKEIKSDMRNKFKHGSLCWEMIPSIALYCWDNRCKSSKKEETFCFFVVSCRNRRSPSLCCVWPLQKTEMPSQETQVETSWCGEKACSLIQVQWEEFSPSYMGVSIYTNIKTSKLHHLPFYLWLIWWAPRPSVCLSVCLSINLPSSSSRPLCPTNWTFSSISSHLCHAGTNRISHVIQGAHEGSIFALSTLRNGTLVSGGKDRRLVCWDSSYQQIQTVEVGKSSTEVRVSSSWDIFESHIISGIKCTSYT